MKQSADEIDQQAADWAARVDRGLDAGEQADLDRWLTGDLRRIGAYGRIRAVALQTERVAALGPVHSPAEYAAVRTPGLSRRRMLAGGALAAGFAGVGVPGWLWLTQGRFHTRKGEVRQLALRDGSVVTLNTASRIAVNLEEDRRDVQLLSGEALFDVAPDKARPFIVASDDTEVRVLGTSFVVRALPGEPVQVLVREGVVEVARIDRAHPPLRLTANMRAVSPVKSSPIAITRLPEGAVQRALAWRDGQIDFEGETLAQAITQFDRYSDTRILVDARLSQERIAGVYQTNDPIGFAKAVAMSLRADTRIGNGEIRIE